MNERIRELAFQAMSINQKVSDDAFFVEVSKLKEFEKFAELIVQECAKVIAIELAATDIAGECEESWKMGMECSMGLIKQHFGVEE